MDKEKAFRELNEDATEALSHLQNYIDPEKRMYFLATLGTYVRLQIDYIEHGEESSSTAIKRLIEACKADLHE